jgi:asparagine N-glycosylation enzyme membrane subunit Stt3
MSISTSATINTVVNDTNYRYISFTTIGSTSLTVYDDLICDILIVGGGGAGGYNGGGGGGGGQVLYYTDNNDLTFKTDNSITLKKGSYTINIGAGGNVGFNDGNDGYSTGTTIICSTNVKGSSPYYN